MLQTGVAVSNVFPMKAIGAWFDLFVVIMTILSLYICGTLNVLHNIKRKENTKGHLRSFEPLLSIAIMSILSVVCDLENYIKVKWVLWHNGYIK